MDNVDERLELIEMPQSDSVYRTEPCFSRSVLDTRSISNQLEAILSKTEVGASQRSEFIVSFYSKLRILNETWRFCYESGGFDRIKHMPENVLYEMRIITRNLNIRILFSFARYQGKEAAVLLSAFHEKNANKNSKDSHRKQDRQALAIALELETEGIVEGLLRF